MAALLGRRLGRSLELFAVSLVQSSQPSNPNSQASCHSWRTLCTKSWTVDFNKKLQDEKYNGLKRRVEEQASQLHTIKTRREAEDPDVNDFVRALMKYCQAHNCYMALLVAAKGKFADLGKEYEAEEDHVDRKISPQIQDAKEKLAVLSDPKYLTLLGTLPYEGEKLTKIVALSRNEEARRVVKMVTRDLGLPEIPEPDTVENKANIVSIDSAKPKLSGHPSLKNIMQFINKTGFPLKLIAVQSVNTLNNTFPSSRCWAQIVL